MYRTVVVPLDGSAFAEPAVATACSIAEGSGARVELLRVHHAYAFDVGDGARWDAIARQDEQDYLARVMADARRRWRVEVSTTLLEGVVSDAICEHAQDLAAPLIVMSTHGRTGFSRAWLGSVADAVVRHAVSPVLLLRGADAAPASVGAAALRVILVALDGSSFAEQVLPHALSIAHAAGARVDLLRIVEPLTAPVPELPVPYIPAAEVMGETTHMLVTRAEDYVTGLAVRLRQEHAPLEIRADVRLSESPGRVIIESAVQHHADVVALATHGRGVSRLVVGSVADKVLRGGPSAVLLVRPQHD